MTSRTIFIVHSHYKKQSEYANSFCIKEKKEKKKKQDIWAYISTFQVSEKIKPLEKYQSTF